MRTVKCITTIANIELATSSLVPKHLSRRFNGLCINKVWLLILLAILLVISAMSIFFKINLATFITSKKQSTLFITISTNTLYIINTLTNQGI